MSPIAPIYFLWQTGRFSNAEIGEQFGLTYSSVTRRVDVLRNRLENEDLFKGWYEGLKSRIEVLPRSYSTTNRPGRLSKSGRWRKWNRIIEGEGSLLEIEKVGSGSPFSMVSKNLLFVVNWVMISCWYLIVFRCWRKSRYVIRVEM